MTLRSLSLTAAALTLTAATGASAQSINGTQLHVTIPVAFTASYTHFAPGTYTVRMVNERTLEITDGTHGALIQTNIDTNKTADQGKVTLHRYGTEYFLESVYRGGLNVHVTCVKSREAKQAQKNHVVQVAANDEPATEITVLAQAN